MMINIFLLIFAFILISVFPSLSFPCTVYYETNFMYKPISISCSRICSFLFLLFLLLCFFAKIICIIRENQFMILDDSQLLQYDLVEAFRFPFHSDGERHSIAQYNYCFSFSGLSLEEFQLWRYGDIVII